MQTLFSKPKEPGKFSLLMQAVITPLLKPENLIQPAAEAALVTGITEVMTHAPMRPAEIFAAIAAPAAAHLLVQAGIEWNKTRKIGTSVTITVPPALAPQNVSIPIEAIKVSMTDVTKPAAKVEAAAPARQIGATSAASVDTTVQPEARRPPIVDPGQKRKAQGQKNTARKKHRKHGHHG